MGVCSSSARSSDPLSIDRLFDGIDWDTELEAWRITHGPVRGNLRSFRISGDNRFITITTDAHPHVFVRPLLRPTHNLKLGHRYAFPCRS